MHVDLKPMYLLQLDAHELSIISRALTGVLKEGEKPEAIKLGVALCHGRAKRNGEAADVAAKAYALAQKCLPTDHPSDES